MAIEACGQGCSRDECDHVRFAPRYAKQVAYNRWMRKTLGYPELSAGPGFKEVSAVVKSYGAWRRRTLGYAFAEACRRPVPQMEDV